MDRKEPLGFTVCTSNKTFFEISKGDVEITIGLSKVNQKLREFTKHSKCKILGRCTWWTILPLPEFLRAQIWEAPAATAQFRNEDNSPSKTKMGTKGEPSPRRQGLEAQVSSE